MISLIFNITLLIVGAMLIYLIRQILIAIKQQSGAREVKHEVKLLSADELKDLRVQLAKLTYALDSNPYMLGYKIDQTNHTLRSMLSRMEKKDKKSYTDSIIFKSNLEKIRNRVALVEEHLWHIRKQSK